MTLLALVFLFSGSAFASEGPTSTVTAEVRRAGQDNFVELDAQAGAMSGLRLKGLLYSGSSYNLAIEGMAGGSIFANSALFPATYGGGVRGEIYIWSGKRHAWMLSPGLDGYYVPAKPFKASEPKDLGEAFGQAFVGALTDVPTRVVLISPNVDVNWLYEFSRHFGFVAGAKLGAAIALNGTNTLGENQAGKIHPDIGLYIGTRF